MYSKKLENISKLNHLENLNKEIPLWLQWLEPILYAKKNAKDIFEIEYGTKILSISIKMVLNFNEGVSSISNFSKISPLKLNFDTIFPR